VKVIQNAEIKTKKKLGVKDKMMKFKWWARLGGEGSSWKQNSSGIAL
jgi:hypothetical protein